MSVRVVTVQKLSPATESAPMIVKRTGANRIKVIINDNRNVTEIDANIRFEDVVKFLDRLWPWERGRHFDIYDDVAVIREYIVRERALVYVMARKAGLKHDDAEFLASATRLHEVQLLAGTLLYRLWLCQDDDCKRRVISAFIKITRIYRNVVGL